MTTTRPDSTIFNDWDIEDSTAHGAVNDEGDENNISGIANDDEVILGFDDAPGNFALSQALTLHVKTQSDADINRIWLELWAGGVKIGSTKVHRPWDTSYQVWHPITDAGWDNLTKAQMDSLRIKAIAKALEEKDWVRIWGIKVTFDYDASGRYQFCVAKGDAEFDWENPDYIDYDGSPGTIPINLKPNTVYIVGNRYITKYDLPSSVDLFQVLTNESGIPTELPLAPYNLRAISLENGDIRLNWQYNPGRVACSIFNIYGNGGHGDVDFTTPLTTKNWQDSVYGYEEVLTGLSEGSYKFCVRAEDVVGNEEPNRHFASAQSDTTGPAIYGGVITVTQDS